MTALEALDRAAADGYVSREEWEHDLAPALAELPPCDNPAARATLGALLDPAVEFATETASSTQRVLRSHFGYDLPRIRSISGSGTEFLDELTRSNVTAPDRIFRELARRSGADRGETLIGVVDMGFADSPAQCIDNRAANEAERSGLAGEDDDRNGHVDDIFGYDFREREGDLAGVAQFQTRHGTHVRALATAGTRRVRAVSLRAFGYSDTTETSQIVDAIQYAIGRGARAINLSAKIHGPGRVAQIEQLIRDHPDVVFIKSAGNDGGRLGEGNRSTGMDLAASSLPNLIVVGAATGAGLLAQFSNYSSEHVHVIADGEHVLSRDGSGSFAALSGTSMATARVTNIVAKCLTLNPHLSVSELRWLLANATESSHEDYWTAFSGARGPVQNDVAMQFAAVLRLIDAGLTATQAAVRLGFTAATEARLLALVDYSRPDAPS